MGNGILLYPDWPAPVNILAAVTTRQGGYSKGAYAGLNMARHVGDDEEKVNRNRNLVAAEFGCDARFQWLRQVHGDRPVIVNEAGEAPEADSLVTHTPGIVLCAMTADCLPVFACSRSGDEAGIIHAGWRGMSAGIIERSLAAMRTKPADLLVWLGPAILACHYEVGEDVRDAFLQSAVGKAEQKQLSGAFRPIAAAGKYHADLARIAAIKLRALGVSSVSGGKHCTYCDSERFFSHRRDGACGRMANMICIGPAS